MSQTYKRGAKPTPTALKILRGNPGRRPLPPNEPTATIKLASPPLELSAAAKTEWRRTGRKLLAMGVMADIDAAQFAAYCQAYTQWLEVIAKLNKSGMLLKDGQGGFMVNPLVRLARDLQAQYTRALAEFGMSPVSRTRVHAAPKTQSSAFEAFLNGDPRTS